MSETEGDLSGDALLKQAEANSVAAQEEQRAVGQRDHSKREMLDATLNAVRSSYYLAVLQANQAETLMMKALAEGVPMAELERVRLARDSRQWQTQVLRDEVETLRQQIADDVACEVTESNRALASKTATATCWTAIATIVLAIATIVLIVATLMGPVLGTNAN